MINLDHLPIEVISLIVNHANHQELYHCALVNKRFYAATMPILWRSPKMGNHTTTPRLTKSLSIARTSLGHFVRRLSFEEALLDETLIFFIDRTHLLEELVITNANSITDKSVQHLAKQCYQLRKLHLGHADITHRSLHYIGQHCKRIRELILHNCHKLLPITLLPFADCPLEYLDLSGCKWLSVDETVIDLIQFDRLTHLELVCCSTINVQFIQQLTAMNHHHRPSSPSLIHTNSSYQQQQQHIPLPLLTYFAITGNTEINDDAIIPFVISHPLLQYVHLLECNITDASIEAIYQHLTDLLALDISYCERITARSLRKLIHYCQHVLLIGLQNCFLPAQVFPELDSIFSDDHLYIQTLGYSDIMAIRLTSIDDGFNEENREDDDDDEQQQLQEGNMDDDIMDYNIDTIRQDNNNNNIRNNDHFIMENNDDMNEVRAFILSLSEHHFNI
ncbi:hypothetical protein BJ944DRAFT_264200 [Cunninghamella echinulata]|nr:hypothetical protein BJ944DRAFT_264200 [Cunninghamella echinulata]